MNLLRLSTILSLLLAFFVIGVALHHGGLDAPMYYDSAGNILEKRHIFAEKGLAGAMSLFPQRPLPTATFYANYLATDLNPRYFRICNIALLAATAVMVTLLVGLLLEMPAAWSHGASQVKNLVSIFVGLIFVIHPVQTYVTLYIWQRMALMACFFSCACLVVYLAVRTGRWSRPWSGYGLCVILCACALLSKENSVTLPLLLIMAETAFFPQSWNALAKRAVICGVVLLALLAAISFLQHPHGNAKLGTGILATISSYYWESGLTLKEVVLTQCRVLFSYLGLIALPVPTKVQLINPQVISTSLTSPASTLPATIAAAGLMIGGFYLIKKRPVCGFGIVFYVVNVLPEGVLVPQYAFFGYRAVAPMVGVCIAFADCLAAICDAVARDSRWRIARAAVLALLAGWAIVIATCTALRADLWSDPLRFWKETVEQFPRAQERMEPKVAAQALGNLAAALYSAGRYAEAVDYYERAIGLSPDDPRKLVSLAAAFAELGRFKDAEDALNRAIALSPGLSTAYKNLGVVLIKQDKPDKAIEELLKGVKNAPHDEALLETIGLAQMLKQDFPAAQAYFERAIGMNPLSGTSRFHLGQAMLARGNAVAAEQCFREAVRLKPEYGEAHNALGIVCAGQGRAKEALDHFQTALSLDPGNSQLRANVEAARARIQPQQETRPRGANRP